MYILKRILKKEFIQAYEYFRLNGILKIADNLYTFFNLCWPIIWYIINYLIVSICNLFLSIWCNILLPNNYWLSIGLSLILKGLLVYLL